MKTLKLFYKEEIKQIAETLKVSKPRSRKLQSLNSKGQGSSEEAMKLSKQLEGVYISSLQHRVRYLYLAYAIIRNKDPKKVEKSYPDNQDISYLERTMKTMEETFNSEKEKEVSNV